MENDTGAEQTIQGSGVSVGWRVFQVIALLSAVSYIAGWIYGDPSRYLAGLGGADLAAYTGIISFLSPIVSVFLIGLALVPNRLKWLTDAQTTPAKITLGFLLALTVAWMVNAFFTPMYGKLVTVPLDPSGVLPIKGGVFLHMVFQHWFQSMATIVLAVAPKTFRDITDSPTPAGLQCAVVECE